MNKISAEQLREMQNGGKPDVQFEVKKTLSTQEFRQFIRGMAAAQFEDDKFLPEDAAIIFDCLLCKFYLNVDLPDAVSEAYELIHSLGLVDTILNEVRDTPQYQSLLDCIAQAQSYELSQKTGVNALMASFSKAITGVNQSDVLSFLQGLDEQESAQIVDNG